MSRRSVVRHVGETAEELRILASEGASWRIRLEAADRYSDDLARVGAEGRDPASAPVPAEAYDSEADLECAVACTTT